MITNSQSWCVKNIASDMWYIFYIDITFLQSVRISAEALPSKKKCSKISYLSSSCSDILVKLFWRQDLLWILSNKIRLCSSKWWFHKGHLFISLKSLFSNVIYLIKLILNFEGNIRQGKSDKSSASRLRIFDFPQRWNTKFDNMHIYILLFAFVCILINYQILIITSFVYKT